MKDWEMCRMKVLCIICMSFICVVAIYPKKTTASDGFLTLQKTEPLFQQLWREWESAQQDGKYDQAERITEKIDSLKIVSENYDEKIENAFQDENYKLVEELYKNKRSFSELTYGVGSDTWLGTLDEFADFYSRIERYENQAAILNDVFDWIATREYRSYEIIDRRLDLAESYENAGQWEKAELHLLAAMADVKDYPNRLTVVSARFGANLYTQMRYQEAENLLRRGGNATDPKIFAQTLEKVGKWDEAEVFWRDIGDTERLAENLGRQGKFGAAADVLEQKFKQEVKDWERRESAESSARTESENAVAIATVIAEQEKLIETLEDRGMLDEAQEKRQLLGLIKEFNENPAAPLYDQPNPEVPFLQARIARFQYAAGRFKGAIANLSQACPKLRDRSIFDTPLLPVFKNAINGHRGNYNAAGSDFVTTPICNAMLAQAWYEAGSTFGTPMPSEAFQAAQLAVETEAGKALSRSAARNFVAQRGGESTLVKIEKLVGEIQVVAAPAIEAMYLRIQRDPAKTGAAVLEQYTATNANRLKEKELRSLISALKASVPDYFEIRAPEPIAVQSLQDRSGKDSRILNDNEAVLLWMSAPDEQFGLVFAVSKERSGWAKMSLNGKETSSIVERLRRQIDPCAYGINDADCSDGSKSFDRMAAWRLYKSLLGSSEIQDVISPSNITTLIIVPSGPLTALPPAVLVTKEPQGGESADSSPDMLFSTHWLLKEKAIAILPSVSALRTLRTTLPQARPLKSAASKMDALFMLADPDYSGLQSKVEECTPGARSVTNSIASFYVDKSSQRTALAQLSRLPCTRREGEALQKILGGQLLLGKDATETRLRSPLEQAQMANAEVVAFATHGLVAGELGLGEPALVLAAPLKFDGQDDGLLTASEVMSFRLSANLVLLSACNTASPDYSDANGLSGLARAFFYAGARSVLASHWRVDDVATQALVSKAVELHKAGISKAVALQQASLAVMEQKIGPRDDSALHPASWAPFTLIGDPD